MTKKTAITIAEGTDEQVNCSFPDQAESTTGTALDNMALVTKQGEERINRSWITDLATCDNCFPPHIIIVVSQCTDKSVNGGSTSFLKRASAAFHQTTLNSSFFNAEIGGFTTLGPH